ncbi:MAG: ribonuclease P protein component [Thermomicrobiales bacterium]|nr:ribonuclease P protein component [Thermomicrobiales bacterium]
MIAREFRIRRESEFERVRARGKSWSSRTLVLIALPSDGATNRYGFAAGKRLGNAVARNRAKRLMREAVRTLHPQLRQGFDIVLIARNSVNAQTTATDIASDLERVARRARLLAQQDDESATQ